MVSEYLAQLQEPVYQGFAYPTDSTKVLTSNFMAPAYVVLSLGMDYKPVDGFFSVHVAHNRHGG